MKVVVDYDVCASTGSCMQVCPEVFEVRSDGYLYLLQEEPDESLRGLCVMTTGVSETRALMANDPAVKAGRLVPEVMSWWTAPGSLPASGSS